MSRQQAIEQFTDRTEPQKAFAQLYQAMAATKEAQPSRVLTYYGMGGIGKSTLLAKLEDNLEHAPELTNLNKGKPLVISFNFETKQEDVKVLTALRNLLGEQYNWRFPQFEVALYLYSQRIGEESHTPEESGYLEQSGLKTVVDVATELPIVGGVLKFISILDQGQAALRSLLKQHSALVKEMKEMTTEEQREKLPYYFAQDLSAYTLKSATPLVIMLDTFECVTETSSTNDSLMGRDYWLWSEDGLIPNAKNTLFVIAGRHKIPWDEVAFYLEQHLLGSLSPEDSASFLTASGIPQELLPHLCKLTDGVPVYLDVCVQQYHQLRKKNITPEPNHFGGSHKKLIQCYVRYMDKTEKELVHMLSFLPEWDKELVREASKVIFNRFSPADYKRILGLSITTEAAPGRHFIHRTVAEILRKDEDNELREDTAQFMVDHFSPLLESADPYSDAYTDAVGMVLQGGMLLHEDREDLAQFFIDKIAPPLETLHIYHRKDHIQRYLELLWTKALEVEEDWFFATILSEKIWRTYQLSGIKDELLADVLYCLKLHIKLRGEAHYETLRMLHMVAIFLDFVKDHEAAVPVYEYLIEVYPRLYPKKKTQLLNIRRNLTLAYKALKEVQKETESFEALVELYRTQIGESNRGTLRALRDLAICYQNQERYEEALPLAEEALKISRQALGDQHPDTLLAILEMAFLYEKMGKYDQAVPYRKELAELYIKHTGQTSQDSLDALDNLAKCYVKAEAHALAADTYGQVLAILEQNNKNSYRYQKVLNSLIECCEKAQQYGQAAEYYLKLLEHYRHNSIMGAHDAHRKLTGLLNCYHKIGDLQGIDAFVRLMEDYLPNSSCSKVMADEIRQAILHGYDLLGDKENARKADLEALETELTLLPLNAKALSITKRLMVRFEEDGLGEEAVALCQRLLSLCNIGKYYFDDPFYPLQIHLYKAICIRDSLPDFPQYVRNQMQEWIENHDIYNTKNYTVGFASGMVNYPQLHPMAKELLDSMLPKETDEIHTANVMLFSFIAECYEKIGEPEIALALYQQLTNPLLYNPYASRISYNIRTLLKQLGRETEAEAPPKPAPTPVSPPKKESVSYIGLSTTEVLQALQDPYAKAVWRKYRPTRSSKPMPTPPPLPQTAQRPTPLPPPLPIPLPAPPTQQEVATMPLSPYEQKKLKRLEDLRSRGKELFDATQQHPLSSMPLAKLKEQIIKELMAETKKPEE